MATVAANWGIFVSESTTVPLMVCVISCALSDKRAPARRRVITEVNFAFNMVLGIKVFKSLLSIHAIQQVGDQLVDVFSVFE